MYRVIEIEGGLRFIQLAKVEHEGEKYLFVVNTKDEVIPIEDGKLISKLTEQVRQQLIQTIKDNSSKGKNAKKKAD